MNKALLIIIDGCRPDALETADTPNIDRLMNEGVYTPQARTVNPSITLPVHFSIFTSLKPSSHGIITNWTRPSTAIQALSITALAKYAGLNTAAFYAWEFLRDLSPPGCLDLAVHLQSDGGTNGDLAVAGTAADHITSAKPEFCFVYLGLLDLVGHQSGFMSKPYLETLGYADRAVGMILNALDGMGTDEGYHIVLHSDHGGFGYNHDEDRVENKTIPWLAWGPSIRAGHRLEAPVSVLNTAPTLAEILGIRPHHQWEGQALTEVFKSTSTALPVSNPADVLPRQYILNTNG